MKSKPTRQVLYSRIIEFLFCNGTEMKPGMMLREVGFKSVQTHESSHRVEVMAILGTLMIW
jgi:hypothetical protein